MLDIDFYMKFDSVVQNIKNGKLQSEEAVFDALETIRSKKPVIYNIETTNRCNMRCKMCPRTTMMTRSMEDIDYDTFVKVVDQISPHTENIWNKWKDYCEKKYNIRENDEPSENHFFLYVISKVIQLHGYGDPLLDKNMDKYVKLLADKGFYTYFSCNPININLEATYKMLDAGISYIKYSIESTDDEAQKKIRGGGNFSKSYDDILKVLDYKHKNNLNTVIVITMINLNRQNQYEEYQKLMEAFNGLDVYVYLKSENGQWYRKDYHPTKSIHWQETCKHPWMTMTIKSNGEATICPEDFNNEIVFGNVKNETLYDIWHGEKYKEFRKQHISRTPSKIKCFDECDMKLVGSLLS
ncbi:MAG: radical SAM protein [Selenomonadaceae bacterium]|nr:radical SAM protein [Selenomonadaceae bacterium]